MTAAAPSRHLQGLMKEILIWEVPLRIKGPWGARSVPLLDIQEPASFKDPAPRALVLKNDDAIPPGPVEVMVDHPDGPLAWSASIERQGEVLLLPFPQEVRVQGPPKGDRKSRELVSLFCRAGALAAPYIKAQREHLQAVGASAALPWPNDLLHRWWERDVDGRPIATYALQRVGEELFFWGELAGAGDRQPNAIRDFISRTLPGECKSIVERCHSRSRWGGLWAFSIPFWRDLEAHLAGAGARDLQANLGVSYRRAGNPRPGGAEGIVLHCLDPDILPRLLGALSPAARSWAEALDFQSGRLGSPALVEHIAASQGTFQRCHLEIRVGDNPLGLAVLSRFPPGWSVLKSCDAAWVFPFRAWSSAERDGIQSAILGHPLGANAPGILEAFEDAAPGATKTMRALLWGGGDSLSSRIGCRREWASVMLRPRPMRTEDHPSARRRLVLRRRSRGSPGCLNTHLNPAFPPGREALSGGAWIVGHNFWKEFETFLDTEGRSLVRADLKAVYTRVSGQSEEPPEIEAVLAPPIPTQVGELLSRLPTGARSWAEALDFSPMTLNSPGLRERIGSVVPSFQRAHLVVSFGGNPAGLVILSRFPSAWSVLRTWDVAWLFPFRQLGDAERRAVHAAVRAHPLGRDAPGFMEALAGPGAPGAKIMRWMLWRPAAAAYFERWRCS